MDQTGLLFKESYMTYKPSTASESAFSTTTLLGSTDLDGGIDAVVTTINVTSAADFASSGQFRINDEVCTYTGKTATSFTGVTRGADNTTAASHLDTDIVGERFSSGVLSMTDKTQVQTHVLSDQDGTITVDFFGDLAGTDYVRLLSIPYVTANGFQLFSAPAFTPYVEYHYENMSGTTQTDFFYETKFLESPLSAQVLGVDAFIAPNMTASLVRSAIVGKDATGTFSNVTTTETTNDAGTYTNLNVVSAARPSQVSGRTKVTEVVDTTASVLQRTVTTDKDFYVTDIILTVDNTDTANTGRVNLRDGTTIAGAITLPILVAESPTNESVVTIIQHSFSEPLIFETGVYIEEQAGTLNITGVIIGYEE
jgi:hypothetical protein